MPYSRVVRWELYRSERWLDLPSDSHRLVYNALIHEADDFGNLEGGSRRLWRWMHAFSQVKTEADSTKLMSDLQDADLVRRYEANDREFWHLPRFKNTRTHITRLCPPSPWCDAAAYTGPYKRLNKQKEDVKSDSDLNQAVFRPDSDLNTGVGVGDGVGVGVGGVKVRSPRKERSLAPSACALEAPASPTVISIPLNNKTEYPVTQAMIDEWVSLYPDCDVLQTLREIRGWGIANPTKRKTRAGVMTHINRWLAKEHNRG